MLELLYYCISGQKLDRINQWQRKSYENEKTFEKFMIIFVLNLLWKYKIPFVCFKKE